MIGVSLLVAACSSGSESGPTSAANSSSTTGTGATAVSTNTDSLDGDIVVFAAASLTEAFTEIGDAFMAAHPDVHVTFNFAASSELATQLVDGAPADVFASADEKNMTVASDAGVLVGEPAVFASNTMQIVVSAGNPKGVATLADLANPALVVVLCAEDVPCGKYATQVLDAAGVAVTPRSFEQNVKGVLTKVRLGEADAGIVYRTDVLTATDVEGVDIPADVNVLAKYPVATTSDQPAAVAFVEFLHSDAAIAILAALGFGTP